ncbi:hypothetical protein ACH5RR_012891 [Cinchona calisaya]|uniref:Uncharacterized protein n=1 Tax=Cinchona calisaya TaxID=153742 RepID=A0ABD3ACF8_9GENT
MDVKDLEANLNALQQLYGLLTRKEEEDDDDGHGFRNLSSDMLNDKSRLLLKNLLDLAAKKVFKVHSEVLEGQGDLSLTECSNNAQPLGDAWKQLPPALVNPPETSANPNEMGFNSLDREWRFIELANQRLSVAASEFGNRHKYCRICQRRIARNSLESSNVSDTRNGANGIGLPHQHNNQSNNFLSGDEREGLTETTELPESPSTGKNKQRVTTGHDRTPSGTGSINSPLDRPASALVESESLGELTGETTQESKDFDYLSKEASDIIKQIEICLLDLRRGSGIITDFMPKLESTCSIVPAKSLVVTGHEPRETVISAKCINELLCKAENGQCKDSIPQFQLPSRATGLPTEMTLPNSTARQPLKPLPLSKTITSPVRSETVGRCTGLAAGHCMQRQTGNPSEEIKGHNQMVDLVCDRNVQSIVAKIESLNEATTGNHLMPCQMDKCYTLWPDGNNKPESVPSPSTCLLQKINEEDLHQNQMLFGDHIIKPGTCQNSMLSKDYMNHQNIQALDSRSKVNQTSVSDRRKGLSCQPNKRQPSPYYKPNQFSALLTTNSRWMDKNQVGPQKIKDFLYTSRNILQHQRESDDTSLSSNSSDWPSQQSSMSSTDREYYLPGQIQKQNFVSPTNSSGDDSLRHRYQRQNAGESSSENQAYSSPSSDTAYQLNSYSSDERLESSLSSSSSSNKVFSVSDSESEGEDYSMHKQPSVQHYRQPRYLSVGSTSKTKISPTRVHKSTEGMNSGKQIGRWKKFKDKLSIIFHHHHHHHHHHHNHPHDDDPNNHENMMSHGKFRSKHTVKTSHPLRGEQALEKKGKSLIHSGDHKNQRNHFNALLGGIFKHIQHSKESKPSKKHIKRLGKGRHEGKVSAKMHWWQLLQRHRRANKLGLAYGKR